MSYDPGAIDSALAAALGDNVGLILELRAVFMASTDTHLEALRAMPDDAVWDDHVRRLHGLAASFGATRLMRAASHAMKPGDRAAHIKALEKAVSQLRLH